MPKKEVVRKKFRIDPEKLERAKLFLGAESDTETINKALDLVLRGAPPAVKKPAPPKAPGASKKTAAAPAAKQPDAVKRSAVASKPKWAK